MILADKEKEHVKIDGTRTQILTELSVLIEELTSDVDVDEIMFAVKLGLAGKDLDKMLDIAKETIEKKLGEIKK